MSPRTQAAFFAEQARGAFDRGQEALTAGDTDAALRWIERARRYAPEDDTMRLALGLIRLRQGEHEAAALLLEPVARSCDACEAWFGLAAAFFRYGQAERAAAALHEALSRHAMPDEPGLASLADAVARAAGWPGWCGRRRDGGIATGGEAGPVAVLDGQKLAPRWLAAPPATGRLSLSAGGQELLGSPIDLAAFHRVEGFVAVRDGGLEGWAWRPADPATPARLTLRAARGRFRLEIVADDASVPAHRPLARPRRFVVPAGRLAGVAGMLHVRDHTGRDLTGSPLDPSLEWRSAAALARAMSCRFPARPGAARAAPVAVPPLAAMPADAWAPPAAAPAAPRRRLAVIIPVHGGPRLTLDCLEAVFATVPRGTAVVVVDDASPEPDLVRALDALARRRRIHLLRHDRNRGFPASANAGLAAARALAGSPDMVLLNSDTLTPPGWLDGLRAAVHTAPDIGTATPLSNDATIVSYPAPGRASPAPAGAALTRLARLAARANPGTTIDIPTAVGFCMYIRRECLDATGLFREDLFAQGYGEENDFCIRARHLGWRHVAVPGVFVAHLGGASFGGARAPLIARNLALLERLHPGYRALIDAHAEADPLAPARARLDAARFRAGATGGSATGGGRSAILVTHDSQGGVERAVRMRCDALRAEGLRPIVLRPVADADADADADETDEPIPRLCVVCDGTARTTPNLRFALPADLPALVRFLRGTDPAFMEVHHLSGHDHAMMELPRRLNIPCDVHVHDYAWFCPRITLVGAGVGAGARYCGEPEDATACEDCIAEAGSRLGEPIGVAALRARSAADLAGARAVITPSADAAARLRRRFPQIVPQVRPLGDDTAPAAPAEWPAGPMRRVCVVGGISPEKGYDTLLACARDAAARDLRLEFVLVGHSRDDERLLATGRIFVTGPYHEAAAVAEIRAARAHLAFLPSIWPETWSFTLGEAWAAGLDVAVFDIGAPAERVRRSGRGFVFPLRLSIPAINNALLAVQSRSRHEWPM